VTLTGTGFTGAKAVKFGSTLGTGLTVNSDTSITITSPAGTGIVDVTVTGPGGTSATNSLDKFSYTNLKTLQSIAITTQATKLRYNIGDSLDLTGLVVTGTYSDGSTKVEPITAVNVTGFNSTVAITNQVLTITDGTITTTYKVQIVAVPTMANGDITDTKTGTIYRAADYDSNTATYNTMINQLNGESTPNQFTYYYGKQFGFDDYSAAVTKLIVAGENPVQAKIDAAKQLTTVLQIVGTPKVNLVLGNLSVTVNDQRLVSKVLVNGVQVTVTPLNNVFIVPITYSTDKVVFIDTDGNTGFLSCYPVSGSFR